MGTTWIVERRHKGEWAPLGGSKRRRYYSEEAAEAKRLRYQAKHPQRETRVRKVASHEAA